MLLCTLILLERESECFGACFVVFDELLPTSLEEKERKGGEGSTSNCLFEEETDK